MSCQDIQGNERDAYVVLDKYTSVNMGSPKGRESYGDGVPAVVVGVTSDQSGDR
jgi:hypothetical protein